MKHSLVPEDHFLEEIQDRNGTIHTPIFSWAISLTAYALSSQYPLKLPALLEATKNSQINEDFNIVYPITTLSE